MDRQKDREIQTARQTDKQIYGQKDRYIDKQRQSHTFQQKVSQSNTQTETQFNMYRISEFRDVDVYVAVKYVCIVDAGVSFHQIVYVDEGVVNDVLRIQV